MGRDPFTERIQNNGRLAWCSVTVLFCGERCSVIESYRLFQRMYEIPEQRYRRIWNPVLQRLWIWAVVIDSKSVNYPWGRKMRCNIAAAFCIIREIVYLDETNDRSGCRVEEGALSEEIHPRDERRKEGQPSSLPAMIFRILNPVQKDCVD